MPDGVQAKGSVEGLDDGYKHDNDKNDNDYTDDDHDDDDDEDLQMCFFTCQMVSKEMGQASVIAT